MCGVGIRWRRHEKILADERCCGSMYRLVLWASEEEEG